MAIDLPYAAATLMNRRVPRRVRKSRSEAKRLERAHLVTVSSESSAFELSELLRLLGSSDTKVQLDAADSIRILGSRRATRPILQLYRLSHVPQSRAVLISLLGDLADRRPTPLLLRALHDENPILREQALIALCKLRKYSRERILGATLTALNDRVPLVRLTAAECLAHFDDERSLTALGQALSDDAALGALGTVAQAAAESIAWIEETRRWHPILGRRGATRKLFRQCGLSIVRSLVDQFGDSLRAYVVPDRPPFVSRWFC